MLNFGDLEAPVSKDEGSTAEEKKKQQQTGKVDMVLAGSSEDKQSTSEDKQSTSEDKQSNEFKETKHDIPLVKLDKPKKETKRESHRNSI